jgi:uncharacterized protein (DUF362 family)
METKTVTENVFNDRGKALVGKVSCAGDVREGIAGAVSAIGGFERLVEPGEAVLVKPNFNTADPPPAASDPLFVRAVIELLYEHGAGKVILGESSMVTSSTREVLGKAGMLQAAEEVGAEVICFDEHEFVPVETGGQSLKRVRMAKAGLEAAKIVYVCCLKTHRYADFTMSLKLAMGFVRPRDRIWMHARRLREKLSDLNLVIVPDLIVVDGRRCFITGGPSEGTVREPKVVLASGDRIAIDVEGLKIIQGYTGHNLQGGPWDQFMVQRAVELGVGVASEDGYRVVTGMADARITG